MSTQTLDAKVTATSAAFYLARLSVPVPSRALGSLAMTSPCPGAEWVSSFAVDKGGC